LTREAVLTVSDNGPGVPPADQPRIWERLYRGDASRSQRGLGLGLSLVRVIVEAHGGRVTQRNAPEGGAVFEVRLPLAAVNEVKISS
jgi:signal transduction histidine kinase